MVSKLENVVSSARRSKIQEKLEDKEDEEDEDGGDGDNGDGDGDTEP